MAAGTEAVHRSDSRNGQGQDLQENVEATNLALAAEDLEEIDRALSELKVHGGRMNAEQMKVVEA